jgi:hypothetical protein
VNYAERVGAALDQRRGGFAEQATAPCRLEVREGSINTGEKS